MADARVDAVDAEIRSGARLVRLTGPRDATAGLLSALASRRMAGFPDGVVCVSEPADAAAVARAAWGACFTVGPYRYAPPPEELRATLTDLTALVLVDGWEPAPGDLDELAALLPRSTVVVGAGPPAAEMGIADLAMAGWVEAAHRAASRAVDAAAPGSADRARALHERGTLAALLERTGEAIADLTEAAALHRAAGSAAGAALARHNLAALNPDSAPPLAWLVAAVLLAVLLVGLAAVTSRDSSIDFGDVRVGEEGRRLEELRNPSGDQLEVAMAVVELAGTFRVDLGGTAGCAGQDPQATSSPVVVVPAGGNCSFEVVFAPELAAGVAAEDFAGELEFTVRSGPHDGRSWAVALRGRGVAAATAVPPTAAPATAPPDRPPLLAPLAERTLLAGRPLDVAVTASDPDGDPITLTASGLPAWAALADNGDGTGTITGTPGAADVGTTESLVTATANGLSGTQRLAITVVTPPDRPPELAPPGSHTVVAGQPVIVELTATDADGDPITLTATDLPGWAALTDAGDGTGTVTGTPTNADAGTTQTRIAATAGGKTDTGTLTITVEARPDTPPNLTNIGRHTVGAGQQLDVTLLAVDPEGDPVALTATDLPAWATLTDRGDGTGTVTGTPTAADAGTTQTRITATAGGQTDTELLTIIVIGPGGGAVDQPPQLSNVGAHTVVAGEPLTVELAAADPDGDPVALSAAGLPAWAMLTDNGDGTGTITGTPGAADAGTTQSLVTATAKDRSDTEILTITVEEPP